jgi:hypothetical protein
VIQCFVINDQAALFARCLTVFFILDDLSPAFGMEVEGSVSDADLCLVSSCWSPNTMVDPFMSQQSSPFPDVGVSRS